MGPPQLSVFNLPWEEINKTVCVSLGCINTVIAADVVYDKDLFDYLISALNNLSDYCKVENFIFSCTERNRDTLTLFQEKVGKWLSDIYSL